MRSDMLYGSSPGFDQAHEPEPTEDLPWQLPVHKYYYAIYKVAQTDICRAPKATRPNYAYKDVVRKHAERRQLQASVCPQCEQVSDLCPQSVLSVNR